MKKYILGTGISLCLLMSSCLNDSFLEVYPKGQQTEATVFTTYDNFKTYAWGLYNVFFGYTYDTGQTDEIFRGDFESDNMIKGLSGYEGQWAYQKAKATDEVKEWDYDYIRRVNLMLAECGMSGINLHSPFDYMVMQAINKENEDDFMSYRMEWMLNRLYSTGSRAAFITTKEGR